MTEPPAWQPPGQPSPDQPSDQRTPAPAPAPPTQWGPPAQWGPPGQQWSGQQWSGQQWSAPPKPGVVPLRPLGLGELLDGAVQTMRHNPGVMFGLSALVMGVAAVVSTIALAIGLPQMMAALDPSNEALDASEIAGLVSGGVVGFAVPAVLQFVALSVLNGILIIAVSEAVIGRKPSVTAVLARVGWAGAGRLVLLTILTTLIGVAAVAVVAVPVVVLFMIADWLGGLALVVAIPGIVALGLYLMVRLAFAAPALLLERMGIRASLGRSWRLGKGSSWRVLGVLLLTAVISWATSGLLQLPFSVVGQLAGVALGLDGSGSTSSLTLALVVSTIIANLGSVLSAAVVSPFGAGVLCLLYIDLRIRREGLDVALARAAAQS